MALRRVFFLAAFRFTCVAPRRPQAPFTGRKNFWFIFRKIVLLLGGEFGHCPGLVGTDQRGEGFPCDAEVGMIVHACAGLPSCLALGSTNRDDERLLRPPLRRQCHPEHVAEA